MDHEDRFLSPTTSFSSLMRAAWSSEERLVEGQKRTRASGTAAERIGRRLLRDLHLGRQEQRDTDADEEVAEEARIARVDLAIGVEVLAARVVLEEVVAERDVER